VTAVAVSVVIPARNAARWAEPVVATLRAQTFTGWEAIVVDDGSTDDTAAAFERSFAGDPRFRLIRQPASGVSTARNTGIAAANGDWLHFLDADDRIDPTLFARCADVVCADPTVEFVRCGWARELPSGRWQPEVHTDLDKAEADMFPVLAVRCPIPIHGYVVRRSVVSEVGGFDTELVVAEDWDLLVRLARRGVRLRRIAETLAFYRLTEGSASRRDFFRVCADTRAVVTRAHSNDPRVPTPRPEYAAGAPASCLASVLDGIVLWAVACAVGAGAPYRDVLDAFPRAAPLSPDAIAESLFYSVPVAAGALRSEWPHLWPRRSERVDAAIADLAVWAGGASLGRPIGRSLERLIVIDALKRPRTLRTASAVLRSPRLARTAITLAAGRATRTVRRQSQL